MPPDVLPALRPEPHDAALPGVFDGAGSRLEVLRDVRAGARGDLRMTRHVASCRWAGAVAATVLVGGAACAPARPPERPVSPVTAIAAEPARLTWQLKVREHVDLWLHGWAMVLPDTAPVPLFRRGWRDETTVLKNQRGILTALDTSLAWLREGVRRNPNLAQGQFVAQLAPTLLELQRGLEAFEASGGNPRRAGDQAAIVAALAQSFTTPADRAWLKRFAQGLQDEYDRWFHQWWVEQQRLRAGVIAAAAATWQGTLRDRVAPFLRETRQLNGEGLLVLPLGGEGRTVMLGPQQPSAPRAGRTVAGPSLVVTVGYDPTYGARPLKRAIQRELENPLAQKFSNKLLWKGIRW